MMNRKQLSIVLILLFGILLALIVIPSVVNASKCSTGTSTCYGQCCKADENGCVAGPCSVIFPDGNID